LLRRRFGAVEIIGVEHDPDIIRLARSAFGIVEPAYEIVEADAFEFVSAESTSFDYVAVDLFAGDIPARIFSRPFLRNVKRLLTPGGLAAINFFRDRRTASHLRRLGTVFPRVTVQDSRKNVVAHCRPR
jgi:spermidine synthase